MTFLVRYSSPCACTHFVVFFPSFLPSFILSFSFRMRLERIKRNQEYLAKLGLEGNSGVLGKPPPKKRKRPRKSAPAAPVRPRSSLSRSTKKKVSYVDQPLRIPTSTSISSSMNAATTTTATTTTTLSDPRKKKKDASSSSPSSKQPRKASQRMDLGIYLEFKRIGSSRKQLFRQAKRNVRMAEKELKYWAKQTRAFQTKDRRRKEVEGMIHASAEQRQALGCTSLELLQEIDRRHSDLISAAINFDNSLKVCVGCMYVCT
jgi:hypothetical protein